MQYFTTDYTQFFAELKENNNREWFLENKARYENQVKKPFQRFIQDLLNEMDKLDKGYACDAKSMIFRIYRDVRFSKDKTPYKTHSSAALSKYGKKSMEMPSYYFEISNTDINLYGGMYMPDKDRLNKIRVYIADNLSDFQSLYNDSNFTAHFGKILGDKNKKVPIDFKEIAEKEELIANKQFYFVSNINYDFLTKENLMEQVLKTLTASLEITAFFEEACN